jgi:endonuclease/exonuclease/phosphatase family metal-dependent hydrolase
VLPAVRGGEACIYDGPSWREASDHRPVSVVLDFGAKK